MFRSIVRFLVAVSVVLAVSAPSVAYATMLTAPGGDAMSAPAQASVLASVPRAASSSQGFEWGDAGIGAAGVIVLLVAGGAGAAAVVRQRRAHRTFAG